MAEDANDFSPALTVPFISEELLEYGDDNSRSAQAEALIKREFGDLSQLLISRDRVTIGDKTLVDVSVADQADNTSAQAKAMPVTESNVASTKLGLESVFRLRRLDDDGSLRIAVQTPLLHSQTSVLRQLINALRQQPSDKVEVDLSFCDDMSISGIGMLLLIQKNTQAGLDQFTVKNGKPHVMQLLKWAGMDEYFSLQ